MIFQRVFSRWKRNTAMVALLVCGAAFSSASLEAQIVFTGVQSNVPISGSVQPGETVDAAGNLYLLGSNTEIVRVGADGIQSTIDITSANFYYVKNLSIDLAGNIYVFGDDSVTYNSKVLEIGTNGTQTNLPAPFDSFAGTDGHGSLYFYAPPYSGFIYKYSPDGNLLATIDTGLYGYELEAASVDLKGRVYIVSTDGNFIADPGNQYQMSPLGAYGNLMDQFYDVNNFMVSDAQGNVYYMWNNVVFGTSSGAVAVAQKKLSQIVSDAKGDLFVQAVDGTVIRFQPNNADFGMVNLCPQTSVSGCSQTLTANFASSSGAEGLFAQALTQGMAGQDFAVSGGLYTISSGILQQNVSFTPQATGTRMGALEIVDASKNIYSTGYLHGTGVGPQVAYGSGAKTTLSTGLGFVQGMATDAAGNLFFVDDQAGTLVKIAPGGAATTLASGLPQPRGVAIDGAGNLLIGEEPSSVVKITPAGVQTTITSNVASLNAMAIDGAGDLFIARDGSLNPGDTAVVEITSGGAEKALGTVGGVGSSVAVDAAGNVYYGDSRSSTVYRIAIDGTQSTIVSNVNASSLQVDAAGDLWVFDGARGTVLCVTPGDVQTAVLAGLNAPTSGALDSTGNLFLAAPTGTSIVKIQRSQAPSLTFASTSVGHTSSDSPQSVSIMNMGNAPLNLTNLSVAPNFAQVDGSGSPADCAANGSVVPGGACNLSLSFTPESVGSIQGSVVLTDNLNGDPATQTIQLGGVGQLATQTISFSGLPATATYGSAGPYMLSATATSGLAVTYSVTGPATISGSILSITGAGNVVVTASQAGNSDYSAATPVSLSIAVSPASQTITFPAIAAQTVGASVSLSATATSGLAVSFASTTPTVCSVSGATAKMLAAGTCTIQASQAGNANYAAATPVSVSFSVAMAATFKLITTPNSETIHRGILAAVLLEAQSVNGFSGKVQITCSGGPAASVCGSFPQNLTVQANKTALALSGILFPANTAPGTYTLTFTGISGVTTVSTTAKFTVQK
jgi:sugar lactone lactonase YvrE